jgi:hypothetical protein
VADIDFTKPKLRKALEQAEEMIVDGYRILRDEVGADNPADNAFLREARICAEAKLIWVGDRGGADGLTKSGDEVEIKSTRLIEGKSMHFPTSRSVSPTVISRFRKATFWLFGVFDVYQELIAIYRVEAADVAELIDELERKMKQRKAQRRGEENNPKWSFAAVRPKAKRLFLHPDFIEDEDPTRGWTLRPR